MVVLFKIHRNHQRRLTTCSTAEASCHVIAKFLAHLYYASEVPDNFFVDTAALLLYLKTFTLLGSSDIGVVCAAVHLMFHKC